MTLTELLEIGDEVVFKVDPERRAWTSDYKDVPDGTRGVVCGFYDAIIYEPRVPILVHPPGVYHRRGAVSVWLADGRVVPGDYSVDMIDDEERLRRDAARRDHRGVFQDKLIRIGDLPATKFWEQDKVRVNHPHFGERIMTVSRIDYYGLHETRDDGSPWPIYDVCFSDGGTTNSEESWMELIARGNVWKHYNDETLSFSSLQEEADFFKAIGECEEVRNPESDLYVWDKDEVLAAIKSGVVHGFSLSSFFGSEPRINAHRFKDEALGRRVAEATLNGFNTPA